MEILLNILVKYGALGLLFIVFLYMLLKSRITIQYPRSNKK